ncbi:toll-like receptor 4 [Mya arenaria]|uniref:toll-like receptor 4 n=1 Tax=Mya arenaria TaxID=6604 RepID=UPI0022E2BAD0|nr:toll-like receptor 4 [Mya arenaria]
MMRNNALYRSFAMWTASLLLVIFLSVEFVYCDLPCNDCACVSKNTSCACEKHPTENGIIVDCSFTNVTYVPTQIPAAITLVLNMSSTRLEDLVTYTSTPFENYESLIVLDLFNTTLGTKNATIKNTTFTGLGKLRYLNISNNDQMALTYNTSENLFGNLNSLKELRMYATTGTYNRGKGYPEMAIWKLRNSLEELWLDGMTDISFGPVFQEMSKLNTVRISGDMVLPPWRYLEFCETNITNKSFENLIYVTHLSVLKCGVKDIAADAFVNMTHLVYLDLSENFELGLDGLTKAASSLNKKMETIIMNHVENGQFLSCGTTITSKIVTPFQNLRNLKYLSLQYNAVNNVEKEVFQLLPSVEEINISRNEFELGFYIFYVYFMKNLKKLDVSFNFFNDDIGIWSSLSPKKHVRTTGRLHNPRMTTTEAHASSRNNLAYLSSTAAEHDFFADMQVHMNNYRHHVPVPNTCPTPEYFIPRCSVTGFLPPKIEEIDISYSKIGYPIFELCFDPNNKLKTISAACSLLFCWEGPTHGLEKVENIDLSLNFATQVNVHFFDGFPNLKRLNLHGNLLFNPIQKNGSRLFANNTHLKDLDISFNRIESLEPDLLQHQKDLEVFNMSFNIFTSFGLNISHLKHLRMLDMSNNHIWTLPQSVRNALKNISETSSSGRNRMHVNMTNNHIKCTCENLDFLKWVLEHMGSCPTLYVNISECNFFHNDNMTKEVINSKNDLEEKIIYLDKQCKSYLDVIIVSTILLIIVIVIVVGVLVHRFRWKISYWYYVTSRKIVKRAGYTSIDSIAEEVNKFRYHVYVASNADTNTFVSETLEPHLTRDGYKLFLPDYIVPGQNKYSLIANAIHISRAALFVITKRCESEDEWKIALHMAQEESLRRGKPMFFGLFLQSTPDSGWSKDTLEIKRRCYLDFPERGGSQEMIAFWRELIDIIEKIDDTPIAVNQSLFNRNTSSNNGYTCIN